MNDTPDSKKLSEDQVDLLLGAFYQREMPKALDEVPSRWPETARAAAGSQQPGRDVGPIVTTVAAATKRKQDSSVGRVVAVLVSMAACVAMVAVTNFPDTESRSPHTIPVSSGASQGSGVVDPESQTTMEEVEGFQFESAPESDSADSPEAAEQ